MKKTIMPYRLPKLLVILLCVLSVSLRSEASAAEPTPLIVAHRGLLKHAPENMLSNFRACLELRIGFEVDVRRSKDGHLVCVHDDTVDRTTNGRGAVRSLTLAELKQLDAGSWFGAAFANERIPTFDEVLDVIKTHGRDPVLIAIDLKAQDIEAECVKAAKAKGVLGRLLFIGTTIDDPQVRRKLLAADAHTQVSCLAQTANELNEAIADASSTWAYLRFVPTREQVDRIHKDGKQAFIAGPTVVGIETANWQAAIAAGIDGILTDYPLELAQSAARVKEPKLSFWQQQRKGANGDIGDATEAWMQAASEIGIEFVRLAPAKIKSAGRDPLLGNADNFQTIPESDFEQLRTVLDRAERHHVKVVLTMFSLPGARWRQQNDGKFDYRLWANESFQKQTVSFWKELATRLKDHPAVVGYNLLNEPHPERQHGFESGSEEGFEAWLQKSKGTPADVDLFYHRVIAAIREVDRATPIVLDARFHAHPAGLSSLRPLDDERVLYSFHFYDPWEFTSFRMNKNRFAYPDRLPHGEQTVRRTAQDIEQRMQPVVEWAERNHIPSNRILLGEFGCDRRVTGAKEYLADVVSAANKHEWHWAFYSFRAPDWDGMDYELGTGNLGGKYWQGREDGKSHESLIQRRDNPLWQVLSREFQR